MLIWCNNGIYNKGYKCIRRFLTFKIKELNFIYMDYRPAVITTYHHSDLQPLRPTPDFRIVFSDLHGQ